MVAAGGRATLRRRPLCGGKCLKNRGFIGGFRCAVGLDRSRHRTSIPDIMASVVAFRKGELEIAVGNLLGSNILNILVVLSATVLLSGSQLTSSVDLNLNYLFAAVAALGICAVGLWKKPLGRGLGIIMLLAYAGILVFNVMRNLS